VDFLDFCPIPLRLEDLDRTSSLWMPFLPDISKRTKEPLAELIGKIGRFDVQIALVWDGQQKKAHALVGLRIVRQGDELVGEIVWLTGRGVKAWLHLLPQMEQYLRDCGCAIIRPICRPGWLRLIKDKGYRVTHYQMEKRLWDQANRHPPKP
jgi:hypothetical protein